MAEYIEMEDLGVDNEAFENFDEETRPITAEDYDIIDGAGTSREATDAAHADSNKETTDAAHADSNKETTDAVWLAPDDFESAVEQFLDHDTTIIKDFVRYVGIYNHADIFVDYMERHGEKIFGFEETKDGKSLYLTVVVEGQPVRIGKFYKIGTEYKVDFYKSGDRSKKVRDFYKNYLGEIEQAFNFSGELPDIAIPPGEEEDSILKKSISEVISLTFKGDVKYAKAIKREFGKKIKIKMVGDGVYSVNYGSGLLGFVRFVDGHATFGGISKNVGFRQFLDSLDLKKSAKEVEEFEKDIKDEIEKLEPGDDIDGVDQLIESRRESIEKLDDRDLREKLMNKFWDKLPQLLREHNGLMEASGKISEQIRFNKAKISESRDNILNANKMIAKITAEEEHKKMSENTEMSPEEREDFDEWFEKKAEEKLRFEQEIDENADIIREYTKVNKELRRDFELKKEEIVEIIKKENRGVVEILSSDDGLMKKIKTLIKEKGLTIATVVTIVGMSIGALVESLKLSVTYFTGGGAVGPSPGPVRKILETLAKGLKWLAKKAGDALPGILGGIVSWVFRAVAGVVGFVAKETWLFLIAAVVAIIGYLLKKAKII